MRIISYNVNGIRAAIKKGFVEWLQTDAPDIICLQEVKAAITDIDLKPFEQLGYKTYWFGAEKKGYSGVAILTKLEPVSVQFGSGITQSDAEGRVIVAEYKSFTLVNAYFPSGTSGEERQQYKYQWLNEFAIYLDKLREVQPNLILVGDYNIAHHPIDIHDPKGNKNSSGFLPEERAWMDGFLSNGWIDSYRHLHPDTTGAYSWWSQRFPSVRLQNKGWRIDYISLTSPLTNHLFAADILPDVKHSDHCPISVELQF